MMNREKIRALATSAGAAVGMFAFSGLALAQDSVGRTASGTGTAVKDNIGAYDTAQYLKNYVVDTVAFTSSWGNTFAIAPIIKTSNASNGSVVTSAFANSNALSNLPIESGSSGGGASYLFWQGAVGDSFGANSGQLPGGPINTPPNRDELTIPTFTIQLAAAVLERNSSGATGNPLYNGIVGAMINYAPDAPNRLYVSRILGATNNNQPGSITTSLGVGAVDANGNVHARADGFGADAANPNTLLPVTGQTNNSYFRVRLPSRTPVLNWIRATQNPPGTVDPTVELGSDSFASEDVARGITDAVTGNLTNANTPNIIPQSLAGRPILMGSAFDKQYKYESSPGVLSSTDAHRNPAITTDHRGSGNYTFRNIFPNSVNGTGAFLAYQTSPIGRAAGDAIAIATFGLTANGAPVGSYVFSLPNASMGQGMSDPYSINPVTSLAFNTATDYPLPPGASNPQFMHYQGNTFSTGGVGQVGVAVDRTSSVLVAGVVTAHTAAGSETTRTDRRNFLAVGRADPNSPTPITEWVVAAWVSAPLPDIATDSSGKSILDGTGNSIGRLTTWSDYTGTIAPTPGGGPSISPPAFDSVGNVYFIAPARLDDGAGGFTKRLTLVRGVLQQSPFGYKLEKVVAEGDSYRGANSGTVYRISSLNLTTTSGTNPVANGTVFSSATTHQPCGNIDRSTLTTDDPRTLGGIVLAASISYDVEDNGSFADITDQNYQALLFITGCAAPALCRADFNGDTFIDPDDLSDFVTCFFLDVMNPGTCAAADFNGDGFRDPDDLADFITLFFLVAGGQPCP